MDTIEAWTTITYLLARYEKMRMGTIVLSQSYRSPALLAKMAANAQWLSGGRFILGIGAGWKENEYRAYGYDYPKDSVRLNQLEEAAQIIRAMWSSKQPTFQGKYYSIQNAFCNPRPTPAPPLLIGGAGPKRTLRIVASMPTGATSTTPLWTPVRPACQRCASTARRLGAAMMTSLKPSPVIMFPWLTATP